MSHAARAAVFVASLSLLAAKSQPITQTGQPPPAAPARPAPPARPALPAPPAPADPFAGNWRGTVTVSGGSPSPIIITLVNKGDGYAGSTNGLNAASESPLQRVSVTGPNTIAIEAADASKLGAIALASELTVEGSSAKGGGTLTVGAQTFDVSLALQRRPRAEAIQPHVEQRIDYFVGRWTFEYVGGEYPPLSAGSRSGRATFARSGSSNFVTGSIEGDLGGKPFRETMSIGLDPETNSMAFVERKPDGVELVSVASWRSPIAISFHTSPVQANGRTYQLRRVIAVRSPTAFDVTEEFSIDGGPFKRLGDAHYTKSP
ncbi:MAG TPA: hypothetical protein VKE51_19005 [Vicinamibacterales bacterium]|nr:hypothetical protein [Vicinamibacterales bacterium]